MITDHLCPYCSYSLTIFDRSLTYGCASCDNHLPVEVIFWFNDSGGFQDTIMHTSYNDEKYSLHWTEQSFKIYSRINSQLIMDIANIPICNPDQAPALLRRLLTNMALI